MSVSGGVDSSVAAAILKDQGYELIGVFMRLWSDPNIPEDQDIEVTNKCCSLEAYQDVQKLSKILDFPIYNIDYSEKFKKMIVDDFIDGYKKGITPNPCVQCNKYIKFTELFELAKKFGAYYVATGHYAQIEGGKILRSVDTKKDQTYYMYNLKEEEIKRILFPVGCYEKPEIRKIGEQFKLPMAHKRDSTEICFVPSKGGYQDFLKRHLPMNPGDIVTVAGEVVGKHAGLPLYTRGQRKGLEISNGKGPYYVIKMDQDKNLLIVTDNKSDLLLYGDTVTIRDAHWIHGVPQAGTQIGCSIRYGHEAPAQIVEASETSAIIKFNQGERAIMPGQSAVCYDGTQLIGGGIIIE